MKYLKSIVLSLCAGALLCGCDDFFDPDLNLVMPGEENYGDKTSIYASYMGILSSLQALADDQIVLSELRGDLMTPTDQAPDEYWEVFRYQADESNALVSPVPYYNMVMSANDFLRNVVAYNHKYPGALPENHYKILVGGGICARTWAYLTIGKLYGEAAYYDYALTDEIDLSKIPVLKFDALIDELIHFMNTGVDGVSGHQLSNLDNVFGVSGATWRHMSIAADPLMTELYLWDRDYENAAKRALTLLKDTGLLSRKNNDHLICSSLYGTSKWANLFTTDPVDGTCDEACTLIIYDYNRHQTHDLQYLFSATSPNVYYLKPTQTMWNKYTGKDYVEDGVRYDDMRQVTTVGTELTRTVIYKYHRARDYYEHDAPIFIYRAGEIHLMLAEALAGLGDYDAADHIINDGFQSSWVSGNIYNPPFDAPIYKSEKLHYGIGVRGRQNIPSIFSTDERFMGELTADSVRYEERRHFVIDSILMEETARELAYEGKRWFAMVRIARNSDRPELLADLVSKKFPQAGDRYACQELMRDESNWFLKYDLGEVGTQVQQPSKPDPDQGGSTVDPEEPNPDQGGSEPDPETPDPDQGGTTTPGGDDDATL